MLAMHVVVVVFPSHKLPIVVEVVAVVGVATIEQICVVVVIAVLIVGVPRSIALSDTADHVTQRGLVTADAAAATGSIPSASHSRLNRSLSSASFAL